MDRLVWGLGLIALAGLIVALGYRGTGLDQERVIEAPLSLPPSSATARYVNWTWALGSDLFSLEFLHPNTTKWRVYHSGLYSYADRYRYNFNGQYEDANNLTDTLSEGWLGNISEENHYSYRVVSFIQDAGETARLWFRLRPNLSTVRIYASRKIISFNWSAGEGVQFEWGLAEMVGGEYVVKDVYAPNITDISVAFIDLQNVYMTGRAYDCGYCGIPLNCTFTDLEGRVLPIETDNSVYTYESNLTSVNIWPVFNRTLWRDGNQTVLLRVTDYAGNSASTSLTFWISAMDQVGFLLLLIVRLAANSILPSKEVLQ